VQRPAPPPAPREPPCRDVDRLLARRLQSAGLLPPDRLEAAWRRLVASPGSRLGPLLVAAGWVSGAVLRRAVADLSGPAACCPICRERTPAAGGSCALCAGPLVATAPDASGRSARAGSPTAGGTASESSADAAAALLDDTLPRGQELRTRLGRYVLLGKVGAGGYGKVYRAWDAQHEREVAVKVLTRLGERARRRFEREVQATARLRHPAAVPLIDSGEADGRPFLVTELVRGEPLVAAAAGGGAPPADAVGWLRDVAWAVEHAHGAGILHRDLKPHNVLIDERGRARVLDFGLARLADRRSALTRTGALLGTPSYVAPEQVAGAEVDVRSDVYGLGATLYYALTGRPPLEIATDLDLATTLLHRRPDRPSVHAAAVPGALDRVCLRCLEKEPALRYATAGDLARDLEAFLAGRALEADRGRPFARPAAFVRRHRLGVAAVAATGLLVGVTAAVLATAPAESTASASPGPPPGSAAPAGGPPAADPDAALDAAARVLAGAAAGSPGGVDRDLEAALADAPPDAVVPFLRVRLRPVVAALEDAATAAVTDAGCAGAAPPGPGEDGAAWREAEAALQARDPGASLRERVARHQERTVGRARLEVAAAAAAALGRRGEDPAARGALAGYLRWELDPRRAARASRALAAAGPAGLDLALGARDARGRLSALAALLERPVARARATPPGEGPAAAARRAEVLLLAHDEAGARRALGPEPAGPAGWLVAGRLARRSGDDDAAARAFERAVALAPEDPAPLVARAAFRRATGDVDGALADLEAATGRAPGAAAPWAERASTWLRRGAVAEAVAAAERACALEPRHPAGWEALAEASVAVGRIDAARRACERALEIDRERPSAWKELVRVEFAAGDLDAALAAAERAVRLDPRAAEYWNARANVRHRRGDVEGALADYERAIELDPRLAKAHVNRGTILMQLGRPGEALAAYDRVIELAPGTPGVWAMRGAARIELGDPDGAVADLERALRRNPRNAIAFNNRARALQRLGRADEALADLRRAAELDPRNAETWANLGAAYVERDLEAAERCVRRAIALDPVHPHPREVLARILRRAGRAEPAVAAVEAALERAPHDCRLWLLRADLALEFDDPGAARRAYDAAVEAAPAEAEPWAARAGFRAARGELGPALSDYDRAIELRPGDADLRARRGVALLEGGHVPTARADLREALRLQPDHPAALLGRARLHATLDDIAAARADLERFLARWPERPEADRARELLAEWGG